MSQRVRADVPQQSGAQGKAVLVHDNGRDGREDTLPAAALSTDGEHRL